MSRRTIARVALLVALAAPRFARLASHQVWIEDDSYLHGAFLLARGYVPYRDVPLPHMPLLEWLMAAVFLAAPITIRTAELVTQAAAFSGSLLVFAIGRRLHGAAAGVCAALVFATSALLFRYHVFEREVFLVVPVLAAFLVLMPRRADAAESRHAAIAGARAACALAIKLTAVASCAGFVLWLWLDGRRRAAAVFAGTTVGLVGGATLALAARYGTDFVVQVFLFRVVHATFPSIGVKLDEVRYSMDVSLAVGTAGVALIAWRRESRRWRGVLVQLACGGVALVVLNPTFWAHTGIELLPWLSLAAGRLLAAGVDAFSTPRGRTPAIVCAAAAAALLVDVAPIRNVNWQPGDDTIYGFGYRDRVELEVIGAFVRARAAPDALVATPPIIAFVANRAEAIPYAEIAGTVNELTDAVRARGWIAAAREASARQRSFWDSVEASRDRVAPHLRAALEAHSVAVVIDDSPDDLVAVPLVNLTKEELERNRYQLGTVTAHYEAWVPRPEPGR